MDMTNLAEATAARLGGVAGIGVEVRLMPTWRARLALGST